MIHILISGHLCFQSCRFSNYNLDHLIAERDLRNFCVSADDPHFAGSRQTVGRCNGDNRCALSDSRDRSVGHRNDALVTAAPDCGLVAGVCGKDLHRKLCRSVFIEDQLIQLERYAADRYKFDCYVTERSLSVVGFNTDPRFACSDSGYLTGGTDLSDFSIARKPFQGLIGRIRR